MNGEEKRETHPEKLEDDKVPITEDSSSSNLDEESHATKIALHEDTDENSSTHAKTEFSGDTYSEDNIRDSSLSHKKDTTVVQPSKIEAVRNPSGDYVCPVCNDATDSPHAFTLHIRQHNPTDHSHTCRLCGKTLSSASSLDRHMLVHSGERPFKCIVCGMAFTTNGNMHRHMRTHASPDDSSSPKTTPKCRPSVDVDTPPQSPKESGSADEYHDAEDLSCPVCGKGFLCRSGLVTHMGTHPNDPIQCKKCCEVAANYTVYIGHRCNGISARRSGQGASLVRDDATPLAGFHDLTFVDFSMGKFSLIAKSLCESKVRRPSSAFHVFECELCKRAFPCSSALRLHVLSHSGNRGTFCPSCSCDFSSPSFLELHQLRHRKAEQCHGDYWQKEHDSYCNKEDFLALLELQTNKSSLCEVAAWPYLREEHFENYAYFTNGHNESVEKESGSQDFADIQSIISVTSKAPLAATSPGQSRASPRPGSPLIADSASASPEITNSKGEESSPSEENQQLFTCKLCKMSFRSLGVLKKHGQLHTHGMTPYACNVCSYTSMDKSTLVRHLRTHNGERPFQCAICKYAFTTKANCERHVRKRHKKMTKGEIRNAMQYNPHMSEPPRVTETAPAEVGCMETICKYCNVDFKFNRVLRHHLRSLHNSCSRKPFCCNICKLGFSTKNNCIRHALKQHPEMKDKLAEVVSAKPVAHNEVSDDSSSKQEQSHTHQDHEVLSEPSSPLSHATETPNSPEDMEILEEECINLSNSMNGSSSQDSEPLNLTTRSLKGPSYDSSDTSGTDERVTAAKSLVSLSELPPPQEEPLDLAVHALDLSRKSFSNSGSPRSSLCGSPNSNCVLCPCPGSSHLSPRTPPLGRPPVDGAHSPRTIDITESSPNKVQDDVYKMTFRMVNEKLSPKNQRSFSCMYCSAGFTLKSNMERHIKRKHPEFARPTRSRNFIPTLSTPGVSKPFSSALSDETRTALRVVLNSKVNKTTDAAESTSIIIPQDNKDECKEIQDLSGRSSEDTSDATESSADLASVSALISTANSQGFQKYLLSEKPPAEGDEQAEATEANKIENSVPTGESKEKKRSSYADSPNSVSCPFCSRKFPWTSSLRRHILTHTGQKPYKCERCPIWFTTKSNCERHYARKHGQGEDPTARSVPDRPFKCNMCPSSTFSTRGNLRKHYYLKHWPNRRLGEGTEFSPEQLSSDSAEAMEEGTEESFGSTECSYIMQFYCPCCSRMFATVKQLEDHIGEMVPVPYQCHLCSVKYSKRGDCLEHLRKHHGSENEFLAACGLVEHDTDVAIAHGVGNDGSCTEEEEPAETLQMLNYAKRNATCPVCLRRFPSIEELKSHFTLVHVEGKPNDVCNDAAEDQMEVGDGQLPGKSDEDIQCDQPLQSKTSTVAIHEQSDISPSNCANLEKKQSSCENGDLIQNLLGIRDSKMIDEMLDSADSAARLLGVKQV
ncbi:ras-responsive element-binding protein 1-like [Ornithodoros turicata]